MLHVGHGHRAGRGDAAVKRLLPDVFQIGPGADVRAEGHGDDAPHPQRLQPAQYGAVFLRTGGAKGRGEQQGDGLAPLEVGEEGVGVVAVVAGVVVAQRESRAAGDAAVRVDLHHGGGAVGLDVACPGGGADPDALVAADAVFIGEDQAVLHASASVLSLVI